MKTRTLSRILSVILCITVICVTAAQGMSFVSAGSTYENTDLISDSGFESSELTDAPGSSVTRDTGKWYKWQNVSISDSEHYEGNRSVAISPASNNGGCSLEQDISGALVGLTYEYSVYVKLASTASLGENNPVIQVKYTDNTSPQSAVIDASDESAKDWKKYTVRFTHSDASKTPRVCVWVPSNSNPVMYIDNASLKAVSDIAGAEISNGKISVSMSDSFEGKVSADDFSAVYTTSIDMDNPHTLNLSGTPAGDGKSIELVFDPISASAADQKITVSLTYKNVVITLDYNIPASSNADISVAMLKGIKVENGKIKIFLTQTPTVAPRQENFEFTMEVDSEQSAFTVTDFKYDVQEKTVDVAFPAVSAVPESQRTVSVTVGYNGLSASASYNIAPSTAHTYYVSYVDGSDDNDGLSEDSAFKSIDKLNEIVFVPGDKILFKKGETFSGTFKPQGSGADGAPVIVSSYGEGNRPVLTPGEPWQIRRISNGEASNDNAMIGGCIYLYNIEYWEIRDIELKGDSYDPEFYAVGNLTTYNAAIRVHNINQGDLHHYVFDNLVIHGFRGPGTNLGKTAGGIQFNVDIDPDNTSANVQSRFDGISITNCEIYDVGRSGVNSLNVWSNRKVNDTTGKWTNNSNGSMSYYPDKNFYMGNCLIHDIDGDGLIVDGFDGALVEYNLVYRTAMHLTTGSMAAVGLFNWNSDNTVFQYNEMYAVGIGGTRHTTGTENTVAEGVTAQDGHGIEVDAYNDGSWVQYNYSHDNAAFMMLCCYQSNYKSYNTVIRYNVSERDGCNEFTGSWSYFYNGAWAFNTEVYNNIMYMDKNVLDSNGKAFLFRTDAVQDTYKFYNNILYYDGDVPVEAREWADNAIDWQSNIIVGFTNKPVDDDPENPNIYSDPLFAGKPGSVKTGTVPGEFSDFSAYFLKEGSPAINKGVVLDSMSDGVNSGIDFVGNKIKDAPDIGAFEYGDFPEAPTEVKVSDITDKTATIVWKAASDSTGYLIKNGEETVAELSPDKLSFTLEDLKPAGRYVLYVYSKRGDEISAASRVSFNTEFASQNISAGGDYTLGDVDRDGSISPSDVTMVLQHIAEIIDLTEDGQKLVRTAADSKAAAPVADERIFREENIVVDTDQGISLTDKDYAETVMNMEEGTFIISFVCTSDNGVQSLFSVADDTTADTHFHVYITPAGNIGMEARNSDNVSFKTADGVINGQGQENTIAVKYDKTSKIYTVYANGRKIADFVADKDRFISGISGRNALTVGRTPRANTTNSNYVFGGTISYIEAYSAPLSDEQLIKATAPKTRTPSELKADVSGTDVTLSWNAPSGIDDITGYVVKLGNTVIAEVSGTSCTVTGFAPEKEFTVSVCSKTASGVLSDRAEVSFTTGAGQSSPAPSAPADPVNVIVSAVTPDSAVISWTAPEDTSNVGGYVIKDGDKILAVTGYDTLSYTVSGLTPSTSYSLTVHSVYWNTDVISKGAAAEFTTASDGGSASVSGFVLADVNRDRSVDSRDATLILQRIAEIIQDFPIA